MKPPLQGFSLRGTRLEQMETLRDGGLYSPLLQAELRQIGAYLRVIDPQTGQALLTPAEVQDLLIDTEGRLTDERRTRLAAEERLIDERRTRLAAEERAAYAEEALRQALERLGEQRPPT